ncbi:MAG: hypothetical protein ACOYYF_04295 [Chloroflexota bacterium]|nr:hypothetical protein [Chloroflexota bacterium]MBI5701932.1 hypothetical protein [Chloroflexota bacterium]
MNLRELIQRVRNKLTPHAELSNEAVVGFLRVLEDIRKEELSCAEIYSKLDEYVECEIDCKDAAHIMPLIREHLDICQECCDEYETLLDVVEKMDKEV